MVKEATTYEAQPWTGRIGHINGQTFYTQCCFCRLGWRPCQHCQPRHPCGKWKQDCTGTVRLSRSAATPCVLVEGRKRCAGHYGHKPCDAGGWDYIWHRQGWTSIQLQWDCCC